MLVREQIREATGHDLVWPREEEDPLLWQFIYTFNFCGVGEQIGKLILEAESSPCTLKVKV